MQQLQDSVLVKVSVQGSAVAGQGYMLKRSENVAAFYIDGWEKLVEFILYQVLVRYTSLTRKSN